MDLEAAREFMREHHRAVLATRRSEGIQQSPVLVNVDGEGRTITSSRDPPKGALVLCIDEKTQIQALDRTQATLPIKPGKAERMTHDYKAQRHHQPLRRSGDRDRRSHRGLLPKTPPPGVPGVPEHPRARLPPPSAARRAG